MMQIETVKYRNQIFYSIKIDSDDIRVLKIKEIPGRLWSKKFGIWLLPYKPKVKEFLESMIDVPKKISTLDLNTIYQEEMLVELNARGYSKSTIRTYLTMFSAFLKHHHGEDPKHITETKIKDYLNFLISDKKVSRSYQNQMINAVKFYYQKILGRNDYTDFVSRPKVTKVIPDVLTKEEIMYLLKSIHNKKHKTITMVIYSSGLRIGELLSIRVEDIDFERSTIFIPRRKRNRYLHLAEKTAEILKTYLVDFKPKELLFEGKPEQAYTASSVQKFLKKYCTELGIEKKITPQSLRHSYAVHLLENGADVRYIQKALDYSSKKATEIYSEVIDALKPKIVNPIDLLEL